MKRLLALGLAAAVSSAHGVVLYDNGDAVIGGESAIRAGGTLFALGAQSSIPNLVADDFSVAGADWNVESLSFFSYQTNAQQTFSFTSVTWSIVSGDVNTGTIVASGTTGVTNGGLLGYRVATPGDPSTVRAIFELIADVPDFTLAADSYWLRWGIAGDAQLTGPWQPPTADGVVGNAQQSLANAAFLGAVDAGDGLGVELPFVIRGSINQPPGAVPEPSSIALLLAASLALAGFAHRRRPQR